MKDQHSNTNPNQESTGTSIEMRSFAHVEESTQDLWSIFKIMGELVDGYDKLLKVGPCISIFGSSRMKSHDPYFDKAREMAKLITQHGFGVITGGGPGVMEAGNQGAIEAGGRSVGLSIELPHELSLIHI